MASGKAIAIVGASSSPDKYGYRATVAYQQAGWTVYPVTPHASQVAGLTTYASIRDIPVKQIDRVSIYLPPQVGLTVLEDIASKQVGEFYVNPGAESDELIAKASELGLNPILACSILAIR